MTTSDIIAKVRAGEITTTQAYNLLTNDLNDYIGNIVSGEQLYVIRYFRGKIEEIMETLVSKPMSDRIECFRCDKCQHWQVESHDPDTDMKHCFALDENKTMILVASPGTFTSPDFFCALWKAKGKP